MSENAISDVEMIQMLSAGIRNIGINSQEESDLTALLKIQNVYARIIGILGFVFALIVPIAMVYQVILRYVFKAPLMGVEEFLQFPTVWLYMIGAAYASLTHTHIECGVLSVYVKKERTIKILEIIKTAITLIIGAWLTRWTFWYATYSLDKWKLSELLKIPQFFGDLAIFIGVLLMTIYALIDLIAAIQKFRKPAEEVSAI